MLDGAASGAQNGRRMSPGRGRAPRRARVAGALIAACAALALPQEAAAGGGLVRVAGQPQARSGGAVQVPPGFVPSGRGERIVGGSATTASNHPWQAALVRSDARFAGNDLQRFFCGGSLITPYIVLTAAHCVVGADPDCGETTCNDPTGDGTDTLDVDDVDIIVGRTNLTDPDGHETPAFSIYVPTAYNQATKESDFAYVTLDAAAPQQRIDLVDRNDLRSWMPGAATRVSGHGAISEGGPVSDPLKVATVPIISDDTCGSGAVYGGLFRRQVMICAGFLAGGTDSCQGDSGGPLQTAPGAASGATRLVGIVSFGVGCAEPNSPGAYTRVAQNPICNAVVANAAQIQGDPAENIPANLREAVVGPAGCSDTQLATKKKSKKKRKPRGNKGAAAAKRKCKRKKKR